MNRQEQVLILSKIARISVAYAEDLYDSFFPKPVVPLYVADWYEEHKYNLNSEIYYLIRYWEAKERTSDFYKWFDDTKNEAIKTLVNMHQFGYEVEKEPRYTVRIKGVDGYATHLNENLDNHEWFFASDDDIKGYRTKHTRKELEDAGFGWVLSCEGVEVKEVDDGKTRIYLRG